MPQIQPVRVAQGPAPALTHDDDQIVEASLTGDTSTASQLVPFSAVNE